MKNHRYRVEDQDFIVSEEEHERIKELMTQGKSIIQLQSGSMVNLSYFKYEKETDRPVDAKESPLALKGESNVLEGFGEPREFDLESHVAFYLSQGWPHGDNCSCKKFAIAKAKLGSKSISKNK